MVPLRQGVPEIVIALREYQFYEYIDIRYRSTVERDESANESRAVPMELAHFWNWVTVEARL
jgi:hypothetical protein